MDALRFHAVSISLFAVIAAAPAAGADKQKAPSEAAATAKPFVPKPFTPTCQTPSYPEPTPPQALGVDAQCGLEGAGTGAAGAQDAAKNNFCASGTPKVVTIADLKALQAKVEKNPRINFGDVDAPGRKKGPTTNRALLRKLGEGSLVTMKAFVLIARQEGPESVNCGKDVPHESQFHDIHISLVESKDATADDECSSVVAEMSPHHRPLEWSHGSLEKVAHAKAPVRVTGHLFFDSSHVPCAGGQHVRSNPKRVSLWEIHPVYKFEVCTEDCEGAGKWLPLDQWTKQHAPSTHPTAGGAVH